MDASSHNGIFELNLQPSCNSIFNVDTKRSKYDLNQTYLWNCRLGHINKKHITKLRKDRMLDSFDLESYDECESCLLRKMIKSPFTGNNERAKELLELIHIDVCGPFSSITKGGYRYFITFTDDFSRYGYVYLLKHKMKPLKWSKCFIMKYKIS